MKTLLPVAVAAALSVAGAAANAKIYASNYYPTNFSFNVSPTYVPITSAGATSIIVVNTKSSPKKALLTFSAECASDAPAGNNSAWVELDIEVNGVAVAPTAGTIDAFCPANGTVGFDGWTRPSITTLVILNPGNNTVRVKATNQAGGTAGWVSDSAIVVFD